MDTLELARALIAISSETPVDGGCQALLAARLQPLGFAIHQLNFGSVSNLWAKRGNGRPVLAFAGHTDVVPTGPVSNWRSPPYEPEIRDGRLYGRGAADMKSSLAAFITAIEDFIHRRPNHSGAIGLLITSDEEGPAIDGTARVVEWLRGRGESIDFCVVGEPSCEQQLGDVIKNGRRGSLNGRLVVQGRQGHVAYPQLADNPIHRALPGLTALIQEHWDDGDPDFPPTSLQISNVQAGTGADNVIPGTLEVRFNFRFAAVTEAAALQQRVAHILEQHGVAGTVTWTLSGQPFITRGGTLVAALMESIQAETGAPPRLSTAGGTSDGRFIATLGTEVVEFGPINRSIHQVDEHVLVADLPRLSRIYAGILDRVLP